MPLLSAPAPVFATIPTQSPGSFVARLLLAFEWALLFAALMYIAAEVCRAPCCISTLTSQTIM